jgi:translation initiation factor IF-3
VIGRMFVNEEIYGYSVIVIDENGVSKGEINKKSAISQAKEQGFDLVQVSKDNKGIPICKFADAGKLKFEASKKKINNKPIETKEMMFHLKTGEHDIQVKKTKIRAMLEKKCFVKFGIELKGRENAFIVNAKELLNKAVSDLGDVAKWDELKVSDNIVFVILKPLREHAHVERPSQDKL